MSIEAEQNFRMAQKMLDQQGEIIKLQGKLKKVEDYCSDILSGYPPSGDQDFVAQGVIDICKEET